MFFIVISQDMGINISQGQLPPQDMWVTFTNISVHYITIHNQYIMLNWPKQKTSYKHSSQAQMQHLPKVLIFLSTEFYFPSAFISAWTLKETSYLVGNEEFDLNMERDKSSLKSKNIRKGLILFGEIKCSNFWIHVSEVI